MNFSHNVKMDFLVAVFARAFIEVDEMDNSDDKSVMQLDNSSYKINKKIHENMKIIVPVLDDVISEMYSLGGTKLSQWVKETSKGKLENTILSIHEDIHLSYLALNVLYLNFCDYRNGKKLLPTLQKIKDQEALIFQTLELFDNTKVSKLTESSYENADHIIQMIKNDVYRKLVIKKINNDTKSA